MSSHFAEQRNKNVKNEEYFPNFDFLKHTQLRNLYEIETRIDESKNIC